MIKIVYSVYSTVWSK